MGLILAFLAAVTKMSDKREEGKVDVGSWFVGPVHLREEGTVTGTRDSWLCCAHSQEAEQ